MPKGLSSVRAQIGGLGSRINRRIAALGRYLFMLALQLHPFQLASRHPWLWGIYFGALTGAAVVLLSAVKGGFTPGLLLVGLVLALVFGGIAAIGGLVRRYAPGGPT